MSITASISTELITKASASKTASKALAQLSSEEKNTGLKAIAESLLANKDAILAANAIDIEAGRISGMSQALLDRLTLTEKRIQDMSNGLLDVVKLKDPIGEIMESFTRPNGLLIEKVRVPLGVIGVIYEARPNVTIDAAALALKTGNSIILRGSSSAINSNKQLVSIVHKALNTTAVPADSILLLEESGHEIVNQMMRLNSHIDVLIPRGGESLIRNVVDNSSVPVIETGMGNCHVYIDKDADYDMAEKIVLNSKTQRPSVCNATETLLVQEDWAKDHLSQLIKALQGKQVAINGCPQTTALCNDRSIKNAGEEDWAKEYLNLEIAIKIVKDIDEAIAHIDMYSTRHTEAIITNNADHARKFQLQVDAASVNHNASTRFTDGSEFGFGAEIGISTQKLHGRGPLGLREITSYKYLVHGTGQIRE